MPTNKSRVAVAALALSAAGFAGLVGHEGFTSRAIVPVQGDRPTYGFGSTFKADGTPVRMGDTITPPEAVRLAVNHIAGDEMRLKRCLTAPLHQKEYDLLVDFAYQYGSGATCKSTLVRLANQGRYAEACEQYARWTWQDGRNCAIRSNNCYGVYTRALARRDACKGAQ
jgi:lysozyme